MYIYIWGALILAHLTGVDLGKASCLTGKHFTHVQYLSIMDDAMKDSLCIGKNVNVITTEPFRSSLLVSLKM